MSQLLLISDPRPLDERLGKKFFRHAPKRPGVYLMRDANEKVLYVGKAKNLQQRLRNYRIANPDTMPRRHLKMLRQVARMEFRFCADENIALDHEAKLIRCLKPRFNRAGVWQPVQKSLAWRSSSDRLEIAVLESPDADWKEIGAFGSQIKFIHSALVRLLWVHLCNEKGLAGMPTGWFAGGHANAVVIYHSHSISINEALSDLSSGNVESFASRLKPPRHSFERESHAQDLEYVTEIFSKRKCGV